MSFSAVYDIAGQSMAAQTIRMNTVASNLANARSAAASEADIYRERDVVFRADPVGGGRQSAFGVTSVMCSGTNARPSSVTSRAIPWRTITVLCITPTSTRWSRWWP